MKTERERQRQRMRVFPTCAMRHMNREARGSHKEMSKDRMA